jgi:hypothetical protein
LVEPDHSQELQPQVMELLNLVLHPCLGVRCIREMPEMSRVKSTAGR